MCNTSADQDNKEPHNKYQDTMDQMRRSVRWLRVRAGGFGGNAAVRTCPALHSRWLALVDISDGCQMVVRWLSDGCQIVVR